MAMRNVHGKGPKRLELPCPICGSYAVELTHQRSLDRSRLKEISLKCMMYECQEEGHFIATSIPEALEIWAKRVDEQL